MDVKDFALRVAQLRMKKGVSARDMSLSMGQNPGYITNIESGHSKPSIQGLFYICEYFNITPGEFFDLDSKNPVKLDSLISDIKKLDEKQLDAISLLIKAITKSNSGH
ncbi:MAG: helix-turn-helix transcriptional regulator [Clostridiales bacterium]|nr:helix-turn-helix transcriptional regulator [Clostridiales bacterium]